MNEEFITYTAKVGGLLYVLCVLAFFVWFFWNILMDAIQDRQEKQDAKKFAKHIEELRNDFE